MNVLDCRAWAEIHRTGLPARLGVHACTPRCKIRQAQCFFIILLQSLQQRRAPGSASIVIALFPARRYVQDAKVSICKKVFLELNLRVPLAGSPS